MTDLRAQASQAKHRNVIDMGLTFSAMVRRFEEKSKPKILDKLSEFCAALPGITSSTAFEDRHHAFCIWFAKNIVTAATTRNGVITRQSGPASYGHGAKVLDVVLKVYVYYSHLPSDDISSKLIPFLHGAIDNKILQKLKDEFPESGVTACNIEEIDEAQYRLLQRLLGQSITGTEPPFLLPVEFDDITWEVLNRSADNQ